MSIEVPVITDIITSFSAFQNANDLSKDPEAGSTVHRILSSAMPSRHSREQTRHISVNFHAPLAYPHQFAGLQVGGVPALTLVSQSQ